MYFKLSTKTLAKPGKVTFVVTNAGHVVHDHPEPAAVGQAAAHGCIRLTNWDVRQLSLAVKKGTKVDFVGVEQATAKG